MLFLILFELSVIFGFLLDLVLADPEKVPHPVVIIGKGISFLEKILRRIFPQTPGGLRAAGGVMAFLIPAATFLVTACLCVIAWRIHPGLFFLLHTLWCWQAVAIRGLAEEARKVYRALTEAGLEEARRAVSRIVGRDTQALDGDGVTRAAVETVAENFSDGVMAPYFYMMIGGAPLALTYKAINTMDSMVGYKNDRYIDFGRVPAHLDDVAGYIPARLGALVWILAAAMTCRGGRRGGKGAGDGSCESDLPKGYGGRGAWRIWRRDNRNHASPNSAQTESACAGALGVQLAGPAYYFGEFYDKPTIGDALRPIEPEDILRTNRMLYGASILALLICMGVSAGLLAAVV